MKQTLSLSLSLSVSLFLSYTYSIAHTRIKAFHCLEPIERKNGVIEKSPQRSDASPRTHRIHAPVVIERFVIGCPRPHAIPDSLCVEH